MEEKLFTIICKYGTQKQSTSTSIDFIYEFIEAVVHEKKLYNYVTEVSVKKFLVTENKDGKKQIKKDCFGKYSPESKQIYIFLESISTYIQQKQKKMPFLNKVESKIYFYLQLAFYILHELDHANQEKEKNDIRNQSFEANLLRICTAHSQTATSYSIHSNEDIVEYLNIYQTCKDSVESMYQNYIKQYVFSPEERLANFYANETVLKMLACRKEEVPNLIQLQALKHMQNQLEAYKIEQKRKETYQKIYFSPTISYLEHAKLEKTTPFFNYKEDFITSMQHIKRSTSQEYRLKYGLLLSKTELERIREKTRQDFLTR